VRGRLVRRLLTGMLRPLSPYEGTWDGRDQRGTAVGSGVYFLRYDAPEGPITLRFVVAR